MKSARARRRNECSDEMLRKKAVLRCMERRTREEKSGAHSGVVQVDAVGWSPGDGRELVFII